MPHYRTAIHWTPPSAILHLTDDTTLNTRHTYPTLCTLRPIFKCEYHNTQSNYVIYRFKCIFNINSKVTSHFLLSFRTVQIYFRKIFSMNCFCFVDIVSRCTSFARPRCTEPAHCFMEIRLHSGQGEHSRRAVATTWRKKRPKSTSAWGEG